MGRLSRKNVQNTINIKDVAPPFRGTLIFFFFSFRKLIMERTFRMDRSNEKSTNYRDEPATNTPEVETIESWTFLGDDSTNTIHPASIGTDDSVINQHDEDDKISPKTSRSSSSCIS